MFEDWKQAWRQAVENFQREAAGATAGAAPRVRAMERELVSAGGALAKLDEEIRRTERDAAAEREAEQVCRRRERLAREVGDSETVRIAVEFASRHGERCAVLERKIVVLGEERALLARDVATMKQTLAAMPLSAGAVGADSEAPRDQTPPRDPDFARLEREARERVASERLEELKRRMRG